MAWGMHVANERAMRGVRLRKEIVKEEEEEKQKKAMPQEIATI